MRTAFLLLAIVSLPATALAASSSVTVELGPITGAAPSNRTVSFELGARRKTSVYDVQDGKEHHVRGVSLRELLAQVKPPKKADTAVFVFSDGMEIRVRLADAAEVDAIFFAFEHGDAMERFDATYRVLNKFDLPCPKVVYSKPVTTYSIWHYPTALESVRLVSWKAYEARLAQPTRLVPDRSGWPLYLEHCASCHGIGGQGAKRGPDFLSHMDAYRRVPPLAVTDLSEQPSLHEKVKGFTPGTMPVLNHIPNADIATLWRWLHAIHRGASK